MYEKQDTYPSKTGPQESSELHEKAKEPSHVESGSDYEDDIDPDMYDDAESDLADLEV